MKKTFLLLLLILLAASGTVFAQASFVTEEQAYCYGVYAGYCNTTFTSPFSDAERTAAWRKGYSDGQAANTQSIISYSYSVSPQDYASLFPNRNNPPASVYSKKRSGITWSPILKYKSKEYILGPDGVYNYVETVLGLRVTLVLQ